MYIVFQSMDISKLPKLIIDVFNTSKLDLHLPPQMSQVITSIYVHLADTNLLSELKAFRQIKCWYGQSQMLDT